MNFIDTNTGLPRMEPHKLWQMCSAGSANSHGYYVNVDYVVSQHWGTFESFDDFAYEISKELIRTWVITDPQAWFQAAQQTILPPSGGSWTPTENPWIHWFPEYPPEGWEETWHNAMGSGALDILGEQPMAFYVLCFCRFACLEFQSRCLVFCRKAMAIDKMRSVANAGLV